MLKKVDKFLAIFFEKAALLSCFSHFYMSTGQHQNIRACQGLSEYCVKVAFHGWKKAEILGNSDLPIRSSPSLNLIFKRERPCLSITSACILLKLLACYLDLSFSCILKTIMRVKFFMCMNVKRLLPISIVKPKDWSWHCITQTDCQQVWTCMISYLKLSKNSLDFELFSKVFFTKRNQF